MDEPDDSQLRYLRLKAVFAEALAAAPGEREAFLARACPDDPALAREVLDLLEARASEPDFLERNLGAYAPLAAVTQLPPDDDLASGVHVGPYQVLRRIGRGGMGAVYLAQRDDDQYQRRVAVKMVRREMAGEDVVARFRQERQILAALDHEHIATLLDGGSTREGQPYLVMEYVEGRPIDAYCNAHALTVTARLTLFRAVCAAVQFAHQNLVIHRDLKPSNVLVTAAGVPKLLDFGIAKLVNPSLLATPSLATRQEVRLMTPEYASPEQARGDHLNAATDVYSLGVMLYELLTGARPYEVGGLPLHEVTRIICEHEPAKPSVLVRRRPPTSRMAAAASANKEPATRPAEGTASRLSRRLSGDLDTIVLKALAKDPVRRYASVEQLSEDIRRHLAGLPVVARPDTLRYRTGKFLARHRGGVSTAALIVLVLLGSSLGLVQQQRRVLAERDASEQVSAFLIELFDAANPARRTTPAPLTARELLDEGARRIGELENRPELHARLQTVLGRVYGNLGIHDQATRMFTGAAALLRAESGENDPLTLRNDAALAQSKYQSGALEEALVLQREVLRRWLTLRGERDPDTIFSMAAVGRTLAQKGVSHRDTHSLNEAAPILERAVDLGRDAMKERPADLARPLAALANLYMKTGDFVRAEVAAAEVVDLLRRARGEVHFDTASAMIDLGQTRMMGGHVVEALEALEGARAVLDRLFPGGVIRTADTLALQGTAHYWLGHFAAAADSGLRALEMAERFGAPLMVASTRNSTGVALWSAGRLRESEDLLRQARDEFARTFGQRSNAVMQVSLNLALVTYERGSVTGALDILGQVAADFSPTSGRDPDRPWIDIVLGCALRERGRLDDALPHLQRASETWAALLAQDDWRRALADAEYAVLMAQRGDTERARQAVGPAIARLNQTFGPQHPRMLRLTAKAKALALL